MNELELTAYVDRLCSSFDSHGEPDVLLDATTRLDERERAIANLELERRGYRTRIGPPLLSFDLKSQIRRVLDSGGPWRQR